MVAFDLKPFAGSVWRPCDFEQNKELVGVSVLSFIENYPIIFSRIRFATSGSRNNSAASAT